MRSKTNPAGRSAEETLPILEETAVVDKRDMFKGTVRVTTQVDLAEEMVRAALRTDTVDVVRVPIGQIVDHPPQARTEGETTIIPVVEEVLVVEKRLLLKEEIHIRMSAETDTVETPRHAPPAACRSRTFRQCGPADSKEGGMNMTSSNKASSDLVGAGVPGKVHQDRRRRWTLGRDRPD